MRMRVERSHFGRTGKCSGCGAPITVTDESVETVPADELRFSSAGREYPRAAGLSDAPGDRSSDREAELEEAATTRRDGEAEGKTDWEVGDVLLGLYAVTGVLGEGGMGKVYKVRHLRWDIDLAVKSPRPKLLQNARALDAFQQECETWVSLGLHPHIVSCYYVRRIGGLPRIFAEYVAGGGLRQWVTKRKLYEGGREQALARILRVAAEVAWGLQHAHANGLVHRDIKTGNILMTQDGHAKVTDFGLAGARLKAVTLAQPGTHTLLASVGGMTPAYCSPEQFRREKVSQRTDEWSWALSVIEMMAGDIFWKTGPDGPAALQELATRGRGDEQLPPMPRGLVQLLAWCLQEDPAKRPDGMQPIIEGLHAVYEDVFSKPMDLPEPRAVTSRAESLNNRAVSLIDLGKTEEAERALTAALQAEPRHTESAFNLGLLRWRTGRITDEVFVQQMSEVVHMHPGDALAVNLLAQVHTERGMCEAALRTMESCPGAREGRFPLMPLSVVQQRLPFQRRQAAVFSDHADAVTSVDMSGKGTYVVSGSADNTLRLWDVSASRCVRVFAGHAGSVTAVRLSRDGQYALSASRDRTLRVWDVKGQECVSVLRAHEGPVLSVDARADFSAAASYGQDGRLLFWNLLKGSVIRSEEEFDGGDSGAVAMARDGSVALAGGRDGTIRVISLNASSPEGVLKGHTAPVRCLSISAKARYALSGSEDRTIRLWSLDPLKLVRTLHGNTDTVLSVWFGDDGCTALSGAKDGALRVWDLVTGACRVTYRGHEGPVTGVAMSRRGALAVSSGVDRTVRLWDMGKRMPPFSAPYVLCRAVPSETAMSNEISVARTVEQARKALQAGDALQAANLIRSARSQPGLRRNAAAMAIWHQLYRKLPRTQLLGVWEGETMRAQRGGVRALSVSANARYALSGGEFGDIRVWNLSTGQAIQSFEAHRGPVHAVCFDRDGAHAYSAGADNSLRRWDIGKGKCVQTLAEHTSAMEAIALRPDGQFLATGGWTISLWHLRTSECVRTFGGSTSAVFDVAWTPDGRYIISALSDETIRMWDVATSECVREFKGHTGAVQSLSISGDGRTLLSGSSPLWGHAGQVAVWDVPSGKRLCMLEGHTAAVNSVSLSLDGRCALSGGADHSVRLWDVTSGKCLRVLTESLGVVQRVALSRDCRYALASDAEGIIQVWILDWALEDRSPAEWDEGAGPYIESFLHNLRPAAGQIPEEGLITEADITKALTRRGSAYWTDEDFARIMDTLGCVGYGWLDPVGVQEELERRRHHTVLGWIGGRLGPRRR